ncbi:hypothetical protein [Clostridium tyrobutyricum]|uniref:hypothetical protein n=1 Tax=Clostridium tyrobutyricum TaxID=1519 RepID=UPI00036D88F5|nr:hypothetical protein [Clostridium tyrobutyricum]
MQYNVDSLKLLSVDIFDTLIFRTVETPSKIFYIMGEILKNKYGDNFNLTVFEFKQIRILAEQKAREVKNKKLGTKEVTLDEIYNYMPPMCCSKVKIEDLEIQIEKKYSYINPEINNFISKCNSKNIPIVLTSDIYFSQNQIVDILSFNKFDLRKIDKIFISSEYGKSKSEGQLFEVLLNEYNEINSPEILHIGDNLISDIINSKKYGIKSYYYKTLSDDKNTLFEREKIMYGNIVPEISAIRKLAYGDHFSYAGKEKVFFQFGASVLGPFLSLLCEWVVDTAEKEKVNYIYPLMREGYILEKMLKNIIKSRKVDISIKSLYVSRKALFMPSLNSFNKEVLVKLFERENFTVDNLFSTLKIEDNLEKFKKYKNIKLQQCYSMNIENRNLRQVLFEYLLKDDVKELIDNKIKNEKELFIYYLMQNFNFNKRFITVDLGFRGTMQSQLDDILKSISKKTGIHLLAFGEECIKYKLFLGYDIRGFIGNAGENIDIVKSITWCPDIIEELMMGNIGSTIGYRNKGKGVEPILDTIKVSKEELRLKDICISGALSFQNIFLKFINNKPFIKDYILKNKRSIGQILERFYKFPTYNEAKCFSKIHHENNFGSTGVECILEDKKIDILDKVEIKKFLKFANPKDFKWPEALVTLKYPNYFIKKYIEKSNDKGYLKTMCNIAENMSLNGIKKTMIYGAGEAGLSLKRALELYNINVIYFIDRKQELQGKFMENIEIVSLKYAMENGNHIYAIGSFTFRNEIKKNIIDSYLNVDIIPKIFILQNLEQSKVL